MQKVTDSYKVQRSSASISDGQGKKDMDVVAPSSRGVATSLATAVPASPLEQPSSDAHDESALRQFDLTSKFGPCTGMSRLERWVACFAHTVKAALGKSCHCKTNT